MDIRLLGPLEVWEDGRRLQIGGGKQAALLALLVLERGAVVSTDRMVEALWGGSPPATAAKNIQIYVSQLRKLLGPETIETRANGYSLALDSDETDIGRFDSLVAQGHERLVGGHPSAASKVLSDAIDLWRGDTLADFVYADFAQPEIRRLEEAKLAAIEDRVAADVERGRDRELVPELESLVRMYPLRERLREELMLALYRSGRQTDALETYHDARTALLDELGIEPGRSLQSLQQRILRQDPALEAHRPRRSLSRSARVDRRVAAAAAAVLAVVLAATITTLATRGSDSVRSVPLNAVGVVDQRTNHVTAVLPVGTNPVAIAVEDGQVWVANEEDRTLSEIDARSRKVIWTVALDGAATGVTSAGGFVWVLNAATPENTNPSVEITKVNPRLGEVVDRIRTDLSYGDVIEGGLAVSGRIAWVPSPNADLRTQVVEGIDLASGRVRDRVPAVGPRFAGPVEVAFADGAVWFVDARGLVRLDPRTSDVRIVYLPGGTGIAVGGSAVWVGVRFPPDCLLPQCRGKPGYVAKVDLGARAVETTFPAADPVDVGVGGGSIWVANRQTNTVDRIDPGTGKRVATIRLHNPPTALAVGNGVVWVVVS